MTMLLSYADVLTGIKTGASFARQKWPADTSIRLRTGVISSSEYQKTEGKTFFGVSLSLFEVHQPDGYTVFPGLEMVLPNGNVVDYLASMIDQLACDWKRVESK